MATVTCHKKYDSMWQSQGNLKTKIRVFEIPFSRIQTLSLKNEQFDCKHYVLWLSGYGGVFVYIYCIISTILKFSNQSSKNKVMSVESAFLNKLSVKI